MWTLTFSVEGKKQVLVVPTAAVAALRPLADEGRRWRDALAEFLAINAQLLTLWRQKQRQRPSRPQAKK